MRILGVDPGLTRLGIGIVELQNGREIAFQHVEVLRSAPDQDLTQRLAILGSSIAKIVHSMTIDEIALERVFVGENLPSVMGVAQISGVIMYLAGVNNIPVTMYTPKQVKSRVTGYGAADKNQVTNMVTRILKLKNPPKPADAADALALAITHAQSIARGAATASPIGNTTTLTPARKAWLEAEKRAARKKL